MPNNKNIVLTAEQAAKLYKKAKVHVIDSKNVGAGYAALSYANLDAATPKKLLESMESAISAVTTGYISSALRAAEIGGRKIGVGDTLGFIERELVISNHDRFSAITSLISRLLEDENKTVMTVFCGKDAGKEEKEQLKNYISMHFLRIESYFVDGGQEINSYIFAIE